MTRTTSQRNEYEPDRVSPPGDTLRETIQSLGMTQAELAERLGRPKKTVNEIIRGKAALEADTALQLESVLGIPAVFWMEREARFRESLARTQRTRTLDGAQDWVSRFPFRDMVRLGWVETVPKGPDRAAALLRFFGVASPSAWDQTWQSQEVAFRRSSRARGDRYAIAAWLRRGEAEALDCSCAPYDAERFLSVLREARRMTQQRPESFQGELVERFARAGVALAWIPEIPKAPISGATRWLSADRALIQVSLRYKTDDQLWFSIFHEAAHVLKHPRRAIFIEDGDHDTEEEREADRFAADMLIPAEEYEHFVERETFTDGSVLTFARAVGVAPGVVVGRLQHEGVVPYSHFNRFKRRLGWSASETRSR